MEPEITVTSEKYDDEATALDVLQRSADDELLPEPQDAPEDAEERTLRTREYPVELSQGDGRTIEARIVPYNAPAQVADPPFFVPYMEEFAPGAFDKQMRAADKVLLNFEHEPGLRGVVGRAVSLAEEGTNFLRATFRVYDNADGDKALQMVNDKVLTGMSVEYVPMKSQRTDKGVMRRLRAHLDKVSLCRFPAYAGAEIVAVRTKPVMADIVVPHADSALTERLEALGIAPLSRKAVSYQTWDPDPDRFTDEEWEASCLVDRGGDAPAKERCSVPVLEPNGDISAQALEPATWTLQRGALHNFSHQTRQEAARQLLRYYRNAQIESPELLHGMARGKAVSPHRPLKRIAVTQKPWDGSASRFTDEQYQRSCLIDRGGNATIKERCSLPVLEPDGTLNANALGAAAAALEGGRTPLADVTASMREAAARKLLRYYSAAGKTPPDSLRALASGSAAAAARATSPQEAKAVNRLDMMIAAGKNYIADEPDAADKATMNRIVTQLQALRDKDATE